MGAEPGLSGAVCFFFLSAETRVRAGRRAGNAAVHVDMYQQGGEWKFQYLYLDMTSGGSRIVLETPP